MEKRKQMTNPALTMTILTMGAFVAGCFSAWNIPISVVLYAPFVVYPFLVPINHLSPVHIFYCTVLTYIMGVIDVYFSWQFNQFSMYLWMSTIRYYGEFQLNNQYHHGELYWDSYTIYHSKYYMVAQVFLLLQYVLMKFVWQAWWMEWHPLVIPALLICLCGLVMRLMAFFTAKSNFTHRVKYYKRRGHELVTWGIYKYFRHPSYTGFYYYSIFSMIMLGNFISAIFFAAVLTKFFRDRLKGEEESLFQFFPQEYRDYYKLPYEE